MCIIATNTSATPSLRAQPLPPQEGESGNYHATTCIFHNRSMEFETTNEIKE